jgi:hypothetical protein
MKTVQYKRYDRISVWHTLILASVMLMLSVSAADGQQKRTEAPPLKDRLFYGGGFGLQFGTITDIEVSPVIGIWVLPRLGIAVGPDFKYFKNPLYHTTIYGGRTYLEYLFLQDFNNIIPLGVHLGLFLHGEYEVLSLQSDLFKADPAATGRFLTGTFLAGGGIRQQVGQRSSLNLTFLWTLNDSGYGLYGNPEIRISFMF